MVLILLPLTWAILVYMVSGAFDALGLTITIVASFIISAISIVALSSIKVLDTGLSDGTNRILFILIFGALFYGGTIAQTYLSGQPQINIIGLNGDNIVLKLYDNGQTGMIDINDNWNLNMSAIPSYVKNVGIFGLGAIFNTPNPNYDSEATPSTFGNNLGFGEGAYNINNVDFKNRKSVV